MNEVAARGGEVRESSWKSRGLVQKPRKGEGRRKKGKKKEW